MHPFPTTGSFDSTLALRRDPYRFISNQCNRHASDAFETRLLLQKMTCIRGEEAAKVFYDTAFFSRVGVRSEERRVGKECGSWWGRAAGRRNGGECAGR